ncbi:16341_t:CDS:2, partial [Dentiscutata heterogama]
TILRILNASFDGYETEISIARVSSIPKTKNRGLILPDIIPPRGISLEREWYLYEEIAQHIQNPAKQPLLLILPMVTSLTGHLPGITAFLLDAGIYECVKILNISGHCKFLGYTSQQFK